MGTSNEKDTRRIEPRGGATAMLLREKYTRRRDAIQRFTERLEKGGFPDEAEIETLRAVGVSEGEIAGLVDKYRT
jgi:hypothetical protein